MRELYHQTSKCNQPNHALAPTLINKENQFVQLLLSRSVSYYSLMLKITAKQNYSSVLVRWTVD